jgi:hypothetical protein
MAKNLIFIKLQLFFALRLTKTPIPELSWYKTASAGLHPVREE